VVAEFENAVNGITASTHFILAKVLAEELGVAVPTVASLRDVPGMTRTMVPIMQAAGIRALSVGVNNGSPAADTVNPGIWRDPETNTSVLFMQTGQGIGYPSELEPGGCFLRWLKSCLPVSVVIPHQRWRVCGNSSPTLSHPPATSLSLSPPPVPLIPLPPPPTSPLLHLPLFVSCGQCLSPGDGTDNPGTSPTDPGGLGRDSCVIVDG
jgi:hypothetical protein